MPRAAHQRTTTYELLAGDPMRIELTTVYRPPPEGLTASDPFTLSFARMDAPRLAVVGSAFATRVQVITPADMTGLPAEGLKTQGLIRVRGDRMMYIVSNPGGPRPESFDTRPGDGLTKVTLKRVRDAARTVE